MNGRCISGASTRTRPEPASRNIAPQLEIKAPGAEPRKITGLHSIDEPKLRALDGATLAELSTNGYLHAAYSMLSSLTHLQILARRAAVPGKAAH